MNHCTPDTIRFDKPALQNRPSPLGQWLQAALRRLRRLPAAAPAQRDVVREAAEVRAWAETLRRSDPRFAADLFAAAERHELQGL